MKKAKFKDNFKMPAGSCIGHYSNQSKQCYCCKLSDLCSQITADNIKPKSEKQAIKLMGGK